MKCVELAKDGSVVNDPTLCVYIYIALCCRLDSVFEAFAVAVNPGCEKERTEDVEIPSKRGDFITRLGTKHAPLITQLEFPKVLYIS